MRHKPVKEQKKVNLTVRCTRQQADEIREEADHTNRSISSLIIFATLQHIRSEHPGRFEPPPVFGFRNKT